MKLLDRSRKYDISHGDCMGRYMQDGEYFTGDGTPVDAEDAGKASTPELVKKYADRRAEIDAGLKRAAPKAGTAAEADAAEKAAADQAAADKRTAAQLKLDALALAELNKMVVTAGGTAFEGKGAKAKAVAWLLDNTEL